MDMTYEVEFKFPVDDPAPVVADLEELSAKRGPRVEQRDWYFRHPVRDFAETDEALRLRETGRLNAITYKGPLADPVAKTRREIEIPFSDGPVAANQMRELLAQLGFHPVREVVKTRLPFRLEWEGWPVEVAIDNVAGLGMFVELETPAGETDREPARDALLRLAARLDLRNSERKSYLCLLLEQDRLKPPARSDEKPRESPPGS